MKKTSETTRRKPIDWEAVCERTRQRCNQLSDEERRRLKDKALQIIYSANAQTSARSR
ncbi:MAG: hypothetical protein IH623_08080 [Verrucomicrobia bacterium]|nr:hypothetical protein [Verrucomicrobiota bacterium]